MAKKKVLIIAYYFPPLGGAGVQRVLKFVKYLPDFGWEAVVLTVKNISYPAWDQTLLGEVPKGVEVFRTGSLDPHRILHLLRKLIIQKRGGLKSASTRISDKFGFLKCLFVPDTKIGWFPFALWKGLSILRRHKIDVIFSTSPPVTAHLVSFWLSKIGGRPSVLDFRDPSDLVAENYPTALHRKISQSLERKVVSRAKGTVTVDRFVADDFKMKYRCEKIETILNGFDPADFCGLQATASGKFEIVYLGTFNRLHDPRPFLEAYSQLVAENREFAEKASFTKVGLILDWDWPRLLQEYRLEKNVVTIGYLPHRESLQYLLKAQVLLLTTGGEKGSPLFSTGKIYEYLVSRKPILAIVPEKGAAAELLRQQKTGVIVDPRDKDRIKFELVRLFEKHQKGELGLEQTQGNLEQFDRKCLTQKLANFLTDCLK
ncbi:MAG: hypothetical protein A2142_07975 [candidate division Zixibacteria bacterium RBG_16_48_11]|nr:MAG: hypothetical protein A2142_07975 [candidate division Zixibacteria bacterium RBG_16_48_11]